MFAGEPIFHTEHHAGAANAVWTRLNVERAKFMIWAINNGKKR